MILHVEFKRGTNDTPFACPFYYTARVVSGLENAPTGLGLCQKEALASLIRQLRERGLTGTIKPLNSDKGESLKERNDYLVSTAPHRWSHDPDYKYAFES